MGNNEWLAALRRPRRDGTDRSFIALFEAIEFTWGGDRDTQFNILDPRGYFMKGVDRRDQRGECVNDANRFCNLNGFSNNTHLLDSSNR